MLYNGFRFTLIFLSLACTILTIFALAGSYANKSYLTDSYLINFHLAGLNLNQVIDINKFTKRDDTTTTGTTTTAATTAPGYYTTIPAAIQDLFATVTPQQLGIADVYSVSYWGYCRGALLEPEQEYNSNLGSYFYNFDNSNVNWTWCSDPKPGFFFDPIDIMQIELTRAIEGIVVDAQSEAITQLTITSKSEIKVLIDNITPERLNLPGHLQSDLTRLNTLTKSAFSIMVTVAVLSFVSTVIQILGYFFSPEKCCLSFLNFLFEFSISLLSFTGSVIVTAVYVKVRGLANKEATDYGIKAFLSINFYAFTWSATMVANLVVFVNLLGHCCGMFGTGRKHYRMVKTDGGYEHGKHEEKHEKHHDTTDSD
ncbi:uncharacterized protein J8A68_005266 [[Candida] subhashii]|uniref:Uncharacterized protein n=1 Tax=[Candida] subhashii TaxID=561895 RepID=A0A8J5QMQ1_9ASCO|nr:uncharacterized protein J8A68_005266 [[Candida] subhashii]KAG7661270.1 hypothetical protein J8A68_005266 [[Candida] subhashii]